MTNAIFTNIKPIDPSNQSINMDQGNGYCFAYGVASGESTEE